MKIKIICTLGPSSYKKDVLNQFKKQGVDIFRINLSHTPKNQILQKINFLKKNNIKNICIDTEGAQVRTSKVKKPILLKKNKLIKIFINNKISDNKKINLYPAFDLMSVKLNSKINIGFDGLVLEIKKKNFKKKYLLTKVIESGYLDSNKGVHFNQNINLPPVTYKDRFAINLAINNGIKIFAISFVNKSQDLDLVKKIISNNKSFIISKIETRSALIDLKNIISKSDALLIDRGDLSRYVPIEEIPWAQDKIVKIAKKKKISVYVATNLLESMIKNNQPTRAESHDIFSTLKQGVNGLVLAAETAIGINPVDCVHFLKRSISVFKKFKTLNYISKIY
jgi:pyruvate kinase